MFLRLNLSRVTYQAEAFIFWETLIPASLNTDRSNPTTKTGKGTAVFSVHVDCEVRLWVNRGLEKTIRP
jgi:hypothetical protein